MVTLLLTVFLTCPLSADLVRIVDADTFILRVTLAFDVQTTVTIRLADVDAPERNTREGKRAAASVETFLRSGPITVEPTGRRSFARWVAHVYVAGQSVGEWLRAHGYHVNPDRGAVQTDIFCPCAG